MTTKLDNEEIQALNLWLHTLCAEHIGPEAFAEFFPVVGGLSDAFWREIQQTKPHLIMAAMKGGAASYIGGSL